MHAPEKSLRLIVEKWFYPSRGLRLRVVHFGHMRTDNTRFVHVERAAPGDPLRLFFFRYGDGTWSVLPPPAARPLAMH